MITIFSVPKPFVGHIGIIQCNAIQSWMRLHAECEIVLCGNDHGTEEAAFKFKTKYIPDITRNEFGTPLLHSVFEQVEKRARHQLLCYVNADIILFSDFIAAIQSIPFKKYLMVGQRWDINLLEPVNFDADRWEDELRDYILKTGSLQPPDGIDYFVFPLRIMGSLPPFAVGRPGWDNWFIYRARVLGIPIVDATLVTKVAHQNHDYTHVKQARGPSWEGPEADLNRQLVGGPEYLFTIQDATHRLIHHRAGATNGRVSIQPRLDVLPLKALVIERRLGPKVRRTLRILMKRVGLIK